MDSGFAPKFLDLLLIILWLSVSVLCKNNNNSKKYVVEIIYYYCYIYNYINIYSIFKIYILIYIGWYDICLLFQKYLIISNIKNI